MILLCLAAYTSARANSFNLADTDAARSLKAGNYSAALIEFRKLAVARPDDVAVVRYLAIALDRLGRLDEAKQVFHHALSISPDNVATQFHLGVTYYKSRQYANARVYFSMVIRNAEKTHYGQLAHRYLDALAEQAARLERPGAPTRWGLYLQLGYQNDDNIPAAPDDSIPFSGQREGERASEYLAVDYRFLRRPDWTGAASVTSYGSQYPDDVFETFAVQQISASFSLQRQFALGPIQSRAELRYEYSTVELDQEPYSRSDTATLGARLRFSQRTAGHLFYRYTQDNFEEEGADPAITSRDADSHVLGLSATWYFSDQQGNLQLTVEHERNEADGINFRYQANKAVLSAIVPMFWAMRLKLAAAYTEDNYPDFIGPVRRETERKEYSIALSRWFGSHTLVNLNLQIRDEISTYELLTYDRLIWGMSFSYVY